MSNSYDNSSDSSNLKPKETLVEPKLSNPQPKAMEDEQSLNTSRFKKTVVESKSNEIKPSRTPFARQDPLEGKTIGDNNRYLLQTLLGTGGMSKVYRALDTKFVDRIVAVKLMTNYAAANNQHLIKRFMGEVKAISKLKHPNIIQILDYGVTPNKAPFDGSPFYVMEYFAGQTLEDLLIEQKNLTLDSIINIISQVCAGLKEAHQKGIIHRDLKPQNIFLVAGGILGKIVKIIDFGIAKNISSDQEDQTKLTQDGAFIGTYRYASPEQCRGLPNIDQRTDIYSLGVILYEAISGKNPYNLDGKFSTSQADWIACHIKVPPKPLKQQTGCADIPNELENLVMKCLAKSPQERFLDMGELQDALANSLTLKAGQNNALDDEKISSSEPEKVIQAIPSKTIEEKPSESTKILEVISNSSSDRPKETLVEPDSKQESKKNVTNNLHSSELKNNKSIFSIRNLASIAVILTGLIGTGIYFLVPNQKTPSNNSQPTTVNVDDLAKESVDTNNLVPLLDKLEFQYNQGNYEECYQSALSNPNQDNIKVREWLGKCGLEVAKIKAQANSYTGAIAIAQKIPNTVPNYQEIQTNIDIWSGKILDYANTVYKKQGIEKAIEITNNIPKNSSAEPKVKDLILKWQQTDQKYQGIIQLGEQLLTEKAWYVAKQEVEKIPADFEFWQDTAQPILDRANQGIKTYKPPVRTVPKTTTYPTSSPANNRQPNINTQPKKVIECKDGDLFNCR